MGNRLGAAGLDKFNDHVLVEHQSGARGRFVRDLTDIGGAVALQHADTACIELLAKTGRQRLAANDSALDRREIEAAAVPLLEQNAQEGRGSRVPVRPERCDGLDLQVGVADARGEHGAADGVRALLHHEASRREVVRERVVDEISRPETGSVHHAGHPPEIPRMAGLVDRPGRGEDVSKSAGRSRGEAAEGRRCFLQRGQVGLAQHGQGRKRLAIVHAVRVDPGQTLGPGRGAGNGLAEDCLQGLKLRPLADVGRTRLEVVVVRVACRGWRHAASFRG